MSYRADPFQTFSAVAWPASGLSFPLHFLNVETVNVGPFWFEGCTGHILEDNGDFDAWDAVIDAGDIVRVYIDASIWSTFVLPISYGSASSPNRRTFSISNIESLPYVEIPDAPTKIEVIDQSDATVHYTYDLPGTTTYTHHTDTATAQSHRFEL